MGWIVKASMVMAHVGPADVFVSRGAELPKGTDGTQVKHLLAMDLIEPAEVAVEPVEVVVEVAPEAQALDDMTIDELKAYAAERRIDLGKATSKADIRACIDAAILAA